VSYQNLEDEDGRVPVSSFETSLKSVIEQPAHPEDSGVITDLEKGVSRSYPDNNPKTAVGIKKPMIHLIPPAAIIHEAQAMRFGAYHAGPKGTGYGPFNWREKGVAMTVYLDAIYRHVMDILDGEDLAADSKCYHLAHIRANAGIILDAMEVGKLIDDRPSKGTAAEVIERLTVRS
jgi:hypothetical protein